MAQRFTENTNPYIIVDSTVNSSCCVTFLQCSFQEGLQQSKVHQEEKHEEESLSEKLLELKNKDEESGRKMKTSRYV